MGRITAKANLYVITDVEGRRLGERIGLDTLVVQAENYECYRLKYLVYNESVSIPPQE
jgi:hypothetical protein